MTKQSNFIIFVWNSPTKCEQALSKWHKYLWKWVESIKLKTEGKLWMHKHYTLAGKVVSHGDMG